MTQQVTLTKNSRFKQGYYNPKHPEKYIGDINKIMFRSSWELNLHQFFDNNTQVMRWGSEIIAIPYIKPTDNKLHNYYPDYYVEYLKPNGILVREVIELKPLSQTKPPKTKGKSRLYEQVTYAINVAKWKACQVWCEQNDIGWRIVTEQSIFK